MDSIQRGEQAKRILEDEVIVEAFTQIETSLLDIWKGAKSTEDREEIWYTLRGFELFKQCLVTAVSSGQFDKSLLNQEV